MNNIRLLVVHDSRLFSDVMVNALEREPDFKVVSCATRIGQARDQLVMKPCDVLLMHVTVATPEMLGFIREIGVDRISGGCADCRIPGFNWRRWRGV